MAEIEEAVTESENPATEEVKDESKVEETKTESKEEGEKAEDKPKLPWEIKRINREVAKRHAAERLNEQLLKKVADLEAGKTSAEIPPEKFEQAVNAEIENRQFNAKCNSVYEEGTDEFNDFGEAIKTLTTLGMLHRDFLELVTDLDDSHKILYYLGTNPEEADRIQNLTPAKQALALAKLEAGKPVKKEVVKEEKKISKAPAPIKTVDANSGKNSSAWATKYYEGMPQDEFNEWDDKQSRKRG